MRAYFSSKFFVTGVVLLLFGSGPLMIIGVAAALGWWPDPHPNPVGPGMLCGITLWPAVICLIIGIVRVRRSRGA